MGDGFTISLCVELDISTNPQTVTEVQVMMWNGHPPYIHKDNPKTLPRAVLTEVTARSRHEAREALKGLIERDPCLEWVRDYPEVRQFLNPSPVYGGG
jgi:hypothetical protein